MILTADEQKQANVPLQQ